MDIFISYRREGGYAMARLLYECLKNNGLSVFLDLEELKSGQFNEKLYQEIDKCNNFLLVLPPNSLERCKSENDWIRLEIEHALKQKKNIIPIMMVGFEFPDNLPPSLQVLPYFNGVKASREYFEATIKKILSMLRDIKIDESKININERHDDIRYYYDEDEQEKQNQEVIITPIISKDENVYTGKHASLPMHDMEMLDDRILPVFNERGHELIKNIYHGNEWFWGNAYITEWHFCVSCYF